MRRRVITIVGLVVVLVAAAVLGVLLVRDDGAEDDTPAALYAVLERAFQSGDGDVLFARLDPAVLDAYGADQCRDFLAAVKETDVRLEVTDVGKAETWTYGGRDGFEVPVHDAVPLEVTQTTPSGPSAIEAHVHLVDGTFRWFTDCGTPK